MLNISDSTTGCKTDLIACFSKLLDGLILLNKRCMPAPVKPKVPKQYIISLSWALFLLGTLLLEKPIRVESIINSSLEFVSPPIRIISCSFNAISNPFTNCFTSFIENDLGIPTDKLQYLGLIPFEAKSLTDIIIDFLDA